MKKLAFNILLGIAISVFIYSCANTGMPSGGPTDQDPPKVTNTKPDNYQVNYTGGKIEIFFNEYVKFDNISENFVISPPLKKKPIIRLKGKSIYVKLEEELKPNTTYTLDFGTGISDNNEGNPLGEYQFVFTTGAKIDSLSIGGKVENAYNQQVVEKTTVMAYLNTHDSVPKTIRPDYVAQPDSAGFFKLNNLKAGTYKLFALVDGNRDYKYNGSGEKMGFYSELIVPTAHQFEQIDTIIGDSSVIKKYTALEPSNIHIRMFKEPNTLQYLAGYKRPRREKLEFQFSAERHDSLLIDFIDVTEPKEWFLCKANETNDTLEYWITSPEIYKRDTLLAKLQYLKTDSLGQLVSYIDTLKLNFRDPKKAKESKRKKKKKNKKVILPTYKFSVKTSLTQDLNEDILFTFKEPLEKVIKDSIHFYQLQDTLEVPAKFDFVKDSVDFLKYRLKVHWKPETRYKLVIDSTAFQNIYGLYSDKYKGEIKTQEQEYYGEIILHVSGVTEPTIVQLLENNKSETLIQEKIINSNQTISFNYLDPKVYIMKVIIDSNNNGKWDTGNYDKKLQPEMVHYFRKEIKVRSNWEVEEQVKIPAKGHEHDHAFEKKEKPSSKKEKKHKK